MVPHLMPARRRDVLQRPREEVRRLEGLQRELVPALEPAAEMIAATADGIVSQWAGSQGSLVATVAPRVRQRKLRRTLAALVLAVAAMAGRQALAPASRRR